MSVLVIDGKLIARVVFSVDMLSEHVLSEHILAEGVLFKDAVDAISVLV